MENYSVVIFLLAIMIILSAFADRIRLPYPVLLIVAGIAVGFIPSVPKIDIDPEIVFLIFLPPLLYDAAFNISYRELRININTVATLSISLVFLTVVGIAVIARYCIPGMNWPLSFVLGAILSATDAVAATSATKGLGLPHKTITILEGESLINDASSLVAYRFALAAVTGTAFILWKAALTFVILLAGGVVIGNLAGKLLFFFLKRIQHNTLVVISMLLLMPFVTYLFAEEVHTSGVIAVVTFGLTISVFSNSVFPETLKFQTRSIWDIIVFLLNGLIFILIGLTFPHVLQNIPSDEFLPDIGYAILVWLGTLILRTMRIFGQQRDLKKAFTKGKGRITEHALLDFKNSIIISWAGMRGIAPLALAIGLPLTLPGGQAFPQRDSIIFISVVVVLLTLVVQGMTLPLVVKKLHKEASLKS